MATESETSASQAKRVAVIGAGASGLTAIKCCMEDGLEPVCFERTDNLGGLWHYTEKAVDSQACVMKSTVINTSKEMMSFSDFPIPKEYPNYMHNTMVFEYFKLYAKRFDLTKKIRYKTEVLSVKKATDFTVTGQWDLQIKDLVTSAVTSEIFDSVLVCTGHHAEKNIPTFPGIEDFKGRIVHTHDYKDHVGYENLRVVVIGIGNSGGDVAVELGKIAKQVYLSTRRGTWVFNRVGDNGLPMDLLASRRSVWAMLNFIPFSIFCSMAEAKVNAKFDHATYGLRPAHRVFSAHPTVNDDLPNRIICGSIKVKADITRVTATGVQFDDGTLEDDIDVIILATGYKLGFPFLADDILSVQDNKVDLYKLVFPPHLEHTTLAIIGCIQPWGAIMPISEMQCRWATRLWKGEVSLPSQEAMREDIRKKQAIMAALYVKSPRHTIQVNYVPYMDELAEKVGCRPNIKKLFMSDPVLGWRCFTDACTPYQYRLHGPHPWEGAREAIMSQWDRILYAFKTRQPAEPEASGSMLKIIAFIILAVVISYLLL